MLTLLFCIGLLAGVRGNEGTCSDTSAATSLVFANLVDSLEQRIEVLETECEKAVSVAMVDIRRAKDDKPISFFFRTTTPLTAFQALSDQTEKYFDHPEDQDSPTFRAMFEGYEDRHVIVDDDVTLGAAFSAARDREFLVLEGTFVAEQPTTPEPTPLPTEQPTTAEPTPLPTEQPTTPEPTPLPTELPTTAEPTPLPTEQPTTVEPTPLPTELPTTAEPTPLPTEKPTMPEQLLFELPSFGSNDLREEYSNTYEYWWKTGDAVSSGPGKRTTYDFLTINQIWFRLPSGLWGKYDLGQCDTLLNIMKGTTITHESINDNSGLWPEGHLKFDKIESEDPNFFVNDVVTVAQGDGSTSDPTDWVVFGFETLPSANWNGQNSIGCEDYVSVCAPGCRNDRCAEPYEGTYEIWGKPC